MSPTDASWRQRRYRPHPDVIGQRLGHEHVLVHLQSEQIFELNRTAARIWELLQSTTSVEEIERRLLAEFDVSAEQLAVEMQQLVQSLLDKDLLVAIND
jgi:hypothetical protein